MGDAVDFSMYRPDPRQLVNAGYEVVLRYLGHDGRCIDMAELRRYQQAGLRVALIAESGSGRSLGRAEGLRQGALYNGYAADLLAPDWLPIFYTEDFGPNTDEMIGVVEFFRGLLEYGGRPVGAYGNYDVCETLKKLTHHGRGVEHLWQCAAWSGSGDGSGGSIQSGYPWRTRVSDAVCLFQHWGLERMLKGTTDHNTILRRPVDWAWPREETEDDDMMNPENRDDLKAAVREVLGEPGGPLAKWLEDSRHFENVLIHDTRGGAGLPLHDGPQWWVINGFEKLRVSDEYSGWWMEQDDVRVPPSGPDQDQGEYIARVDQAVEVVKGVTGPTDTMKLAAAIVAELEPALARTVAETITSISPGLAAAVIGELDGSTVHFEPK